MFGWSSAVGSWLTCPPNIVPGAAHRQYIIFDQSQFMSNRLLGKFRKHKNSISFILATAREKPTGGPNVPSPALIELNNGRFPVRSHRWYLIRASTVGKKIPLIRLSKKSQFEAGGSGSCNCSAILSPLTSKPVGCHIVAGSGVVPLQWRSSLQDYRTTGARSHLCWGPAATWT